MEITNTFLMVDKKTCRQGKVKEITASFQLQINHTKDKHVQYTGCPKVPYANLEGRSGMQEQVTSTKEQAVRNWQIGF